MKKITLLFIIHTVFFGFSQQGIGNYIYGENRDDQSGYSVSLNNDGTIVAIGAPYNNGNSGANTGHVRIFRKELQSGLFTQIGNDIDGPSFSFSGESVSLSADGNVVAIGASNASFSNGLVRIYKNLSDTWTKVGDDILSEANVDLFGYSVSLSADGSIVAVGAPYNDGDNKPNCGHVRVYQNQSGSWIQIGNDIDGEAADDQSGYSVSLSSDGNIIAIGAINNDSNGNNSGHVRVYENQSGSWIQIGNDIDGEMQLNKFGYSVSLNGDGNIVAVGAPFNNDQGIDSGQVRLFKRISNSWIQIGGDINGNSESDQFGYSVSLSDSGNVVAIGAPKRDGVGLNVGQVSIYENHNETWVQVGSNILGFNGNDNEGSCVSLSGDGNILASGAIGGDQSTGVSGINKGRVRVFALSSILTSQNFELNNVITLYPNPVKDILTIKLEGINEIQSISVLTLEGREVLQNTKQQSINIEKLNTDIYLVKIIDVAGKVGVQKIVKE